MAYFGFTNKLLHNEMVEIFNYGNCKRDFTYVDDIVEGVKRVMAGAPEKKLVKMDFQFHHMRFTTSEMEIRKVCLIL